MILLLMPPLIVILFEFYSKNKSKTFYKRINNTQKQKFLTTMPQEHIITNNYTTIGNTLLKCTINAQTYSTNFTYYKQHRQLMRKNYTLYIFKSIFKVFIIALIFANYYLNFVSIDIKVSLK